MPITMGSLSCRLFRVDGKPSANFRDTFPKQIHRYRYQPPRVDDGEMRSIGWVNPRRILQTDIDLDQVLMGEWLTLALRIDKIALNSRLFKARLYEVMDQVRKEKHRDRLSRDERSAIQNQVQLEMARKQTPSTIIHEMAWNLKDSTLIFTGTSDKLCLEFQEFFNETFDLAMEPLCPFIRADKASQKLKLGRELLAVQPAAFSPRTIIPVALGHAEEGE